MTSYVPKGLSLDRLYGKDIFEGIDNLRLYANQPPANKEPLFALVKEPLQPQSWLYAVSLFSRVYFRGVKISYLDGTIATLRLRTASAVSIAQTDDSELVLLETPFILDTPDAIIIECLEAQTEISVLVQTIFSESFSGTEHTNRGYPYTDRTAPSWKP